MEEKRQRIRGIRLYPPEFTLDPEYVDNFDVGNRLERRLSHLIAMDDDQAHLLQCRADGILLVADVGSGFQSYDVDSDVTANAYPSSPQIEATDLYGRFDLIVETYPVTIQFRNKTDTAWQGAFSLDVGEYSFDLVSKSIQAKNKTTDLVSTLTVIGWY